MNTLFPLTRDFRIVRVGAQDAKRETDRLRTLTELLMINEAMYPKIEQWIRGKVLPGLRDESRIAFIGYEGEEPVASAVVKRGPNAKFCHLRVVDGLEDQSLGEIFFILMALEVRHGAREIHFTLPEGLWDRKKEFFRSFAFEDASVAATQYRLFEEELRSSATFEAVWSRALGKLPKLMRRFSVNNYAMSPGLLLSVKPEFARGICTGEKTVEIRRRFSEHWQGERVTLYSSRPDCLLVGEATIRRIERGSPEEIWQKYGLAAGCQEEEFEQYTEGIENVSAIVLDTVRPYLHPIPLAQMERLVGAPLRPPQSFCKLRPEEAWAKAASIAALLHGALNRAVGKPVEQGHLALV